VTISPSVNVQITSSSTSSDISSPTTGSNNEATADTATVEAEPSARVSPASSSSGPSPKATTTTPTPTSSRPPVSELEEAQLARATAAGHSAGQKLVGLRSAVEKTPPRPGGRGKPAYYVVVRSIPTSTFQGTLLSWERTLTYVGSGRGIHPFTIFHSFPTEAEAKAYWAAAVPSLPFIIYQ